MKIVMDFDCGCNKILWLGDIIITLTILLTTKYDKI